LPFEAAKTSKLRTVELNTDAHNVSRRPVGRVTEQRATTPAGRKPAERTVAGGTVTRTDSTESFHWPVRGKLIAAFDPRADGQRNDGINIAVPENTPIKAAAGGVVVFASNELKSYGNLALVKHADDYVTVYAHARELRVKAGDHIKAGEVIGFSGRTGEADTPQLHFEIRKGTRPVDPMQLLRGDDTTLRR
jgi:murein DD-endopeptidase MepM/ murein hydrolase activator NlpD